MGASRDSSKPALGHDDFHVFHQIGWRAGRVDSMDPADVTPDGRLPNADKGAPSATLSHLRKDVFYRMGFNDREIVALSGAHALGRCHPDASGYGRRARS